MYVRMLDVGCWRPGEENDDDHGVLVVRIKGKG